ncbi:hypothetical protein ACTXGQ_08170 [Marinobacter sp. 1Y8]
MDWAGWVEPENQHILFGATTPALGLSFRDTDSVSGTCAVISTDAR